MNSKYAFLLLIFTGFFGSFIIYYLLASIINPYGLFPWGIDPIVDQDGPQKELLVRNKTSIDVLVLGSSRSTLLSDDYLDNISLFNFANTLGRTEDAYAILSTLIYDYKLKPKVVIYGLDVEAFNPDEEFNSFLLSNPKYFNKLVDNLKELRRQTLILKRIFSVFYIKDMMMSITARKQYANYIVDQNGILEKPFKGSSCEWKGDTMFFLQKQYKSKELSEKRINYFRKFINLTSNENITLIVFITPLNPSVFQEVNKTTTYSHRLEKTINLLKEYDNSIYFFDLSDNLAFGGNPLFYYDCVHPNRNNSNKIMMKIYPGFSNVI